MIASARIVPLLAETRPSHRIASHNSPLALCLAAVAAANKDMPFFNPACRVLH
jgi:hypothetical protein